MKNLVIIVLVILSQSSWAQASATADFKITVNFERTIPVADLEVYSYTKNGNAIKSFRIELDTIRNSIEIRGSNGYIVSVDFPTLYFSFKEKYIINEYTGQVLTRNNIFYLVTASSISSYDENLGKEIKFSKERPNVLVTAKNINGKYEYNVENFTDSEIDYRFREELDISNYSLRLK